MHTFVLDIRQNVENSKVNLRNSFALEASANHCIEFEQVETLREFFAHNRSQEEPWYLLSGGNNVLFTKNYPGVILHPISRGMELLTQADTRITPKPDSVFIQVAAGEEWDDFVAWAVERGYGGVENLSLIPGYVGAAPVQNIGAYGVEAKDVIDSVEVYLVDSDQVVRMWAAECGFAYRDSVFKQVLRGKAIILSVVFRLSTKPEFRLDYGDLRAQVERDGSPTLARVRAAVIDIRQSKLPDPAVLGNAGSFFKNPVVEPAVVERLRACYPDMPAYPAPEGCFKLAAGWLIDRAGWKGRREGAVGVHHAQALVLVNYGGATGAEVIAFAKKIQHDVYLQFKVEIEPEVNVL